jgi:transcriptional regulator with XRE-family HTH domain
MYMKNRLIMFLNRKGITPSKFADEIGIQRSNVSHIMSGRNKPGYDFICKILSKYPEISAEWLLLGQGEMEKASVDPILFTQSEMKTSSSLKESKDINTNLDSESVNKSIEITNVNDNEAIDKILILYKDNTFTTYKGRSK